MSLWTFKYFVSARGVDEIRKWYDNQSEEVQAEFDAAKLYLKSQPQVNWRRPDAAPLQREGKGLYEIRFKADRVQQRPLGYFGPNDNEFAILICAIEKGGKFIPKDACEIALRRMKYITQGLCTCCTWKED